MYTSQTNLLCFHNTNTLLKSDAFLCLEFEIVFACQINKQPNDGKKQTFFTLNNTNALFFSLCQIDISLAFQSDRKFLGVNWSIRLFIWYANEWIVSYQMLIISIGPYHIFQSALLYLGTNVHVNSITCNSHRIIVGEWETHFHRYALNILHIYYVKFSSRANNNHNIQSDLHFSFKYFSFNEFNKYKWLSPHLFTAFIIAECILYTIIIVCNVNNVLYSQNPYCPYSLCALLCAFIRCT